MAIQAGLVLLVVGLYMPTRSYGLIWDDRGFIGPNLAVWNARALLRAFSSDANLGADPAVLRSNLFRPLPFASFYLNSRLLGPEPGALHLGNLLLHALATLLLFGLLRGRLGTEEPRGLGAAGLAAALWAAHPEHVEAVAWVSGRYDLLGTCCVLGALLLQSRPGRWAAPGQAVLLLGALLCKETFVAAFAVVFLDNWSSRHEWTRRRALCLGGALVCYLALRSNADLAPLSEGWVLPTSQVLSDYLSTLGIYLGRALEPLPLSLDHPYHRLAWPAQLLAAAVLAGALLAVRRQRSTWVSPISTFLVPLLLVALALPSLRSAAERYFMFPSVGLAWALALGLLAFLSRVGRRATGAIAVAVGLALVLEVRTTSAGIAQWRSEETIYQAATDADPAGWFGPFHLGIVRSRDGDQAAGLRLLAQSLEAAKLRNAPSLPLAQILCAQAIAYLRLNNIPLALQTSGTARDLEPDHPGFRTIHAAALTADGQFGLALVDLDVALTHSPAYYRARALRALVRSISGDRFGALADLAVDSEGEPDPGAEQFRNRARELLGPGS